MPLKNAVTARTLVQATGGLSALSLERARFDSALNPGLGIFGWFSNQGDIPMPLAGGPFGSNEARGGRFWDAAAKVEQSRARLSTGRPQRASLRMRLRCANRISTFLR